MLTESPRLLQLPASEARRCAANPGVESSLRRLDRVLQEAIAQLEGYFDRDTSTSAYRGLSIPLSDAPRLLALDPGAGAWSLPDQEDDRPRFLPDGGASRLATLQRRFGLDGFDTDVLLIAASPDLDQRYERLFGLLQDDITRRRPSLATAARLASARPLPQWQTVARLASPRSVLTASGLVRVVADPAQPHATLGAHVLVADPLVVGFLAGHEAGDLSPFELLPPEPQAYFADTWRRHPALADVAQASARSLHFVGATAWERRQLAHALASRLGAGLVCLHLDGTQAPEVEAAAIAQAELAARLHAAVLLVEGAASPRAAALPGQGAWRVFAGADDAPCAGLRVHVRMPAAAERRARWQARLQCAGFQVSGRDLDELAQGFELDGAQIDTAAQTACIGARGPALAGPALLSAVQRSLQVRLPRTLVAIEPKARWRHLILASDTEQQMRDVCVHARERFRVLDDWGLGAGATRGRGLTVLLSGGSGTGKSTACEVLAAELGRSLLRVDLSQVVSKYVGESEKHLAEAFDIAERSGAVLMFDEADALFGKRTAVSDAHDRYANLEVSYLLQRIEAFQGIVLLTTNLQANIDAAFLRRLQFVVEFGFPDAALRERIWRLNLPTTAPLDDDLDLPQLAARYAVAGGSLRNIALAAAVQAAARNERLSMRHIELGARREYQKLGKQLPEGGYFAQGAPR